MIFSGGVVVRDLRMLFGVNDRSVAAEEAFTNRQAQWQAVVAALTDHLQRVASPAFDVEDLASGRHNVVVGHGVGGIGKSTLSRKIEASLTHPGGRPVQWDAPAWPLERILPVRIDLARSSGIDFERVVLSIRLAVAALGRPMPAFDLALRRHWDRNHPGEPLEEYLRRGGMFSRFSNAVNLPQQMQSALADVAQALTMPGTVGGAVGHLTTSLVGALRERRQTVRALAGCTRLADILEAEPDLETLSFATHLGSPTKCGLSGDGIRVLIVSRDRRDRFPPRWSGRVHQRGWLRRGGRPVGVVAAGWVNGRWPAAR